MSREVLGKCHLIPQLIAIIAALNIIIVLALADEDSCTGKETCDKCIQTAKCVWCKDPDVSLKERCVHLVNKDKLALEGCKDFEIVNSRFQLIKNENTRSAKILANGTKVTPIHISPQVVNLELRVGEPVEIKMEYLDAEEKPLDLYYLMDLSHTMSDDRKTVATQSSKLAKALRNITSNVRFGFGSFVDKPVMPFVSTYQLIKRDDIEVPYSFKNHLKLDTNYAKFKTALETTKNSTNLDEPEGGLDAIMQAIACTDQIGWQNNSRKLLIMSTDGPFHIAGDGKLAGIVIPNDGKCHLENDEYTHATILDYPSIGQLNAKVKKSGVYLIFAVTQNQSSLYDKLKQRIDNSEVVTLEEDSGNIVEVITKEYRKIQSTLKLDEDREQNDGFRDYEIVYKYKCNGTSEEHNYNFKKPSCSTTHDQKITFTLTVQLLESACNNPDLIRIVNITRSEIRDQERLQLKIKAICDCNCKNEIKTPQIIAEDSNKYCKRNGNLTCGICECNDGYRGKECECRIKSGSSDSSDTKNCMDDSGRTCSDRGACSCGECVCDDKRYTGDLCQYDSYNCRNKFSKTCSGHGTCENGKCACSTGFTGLHCNCKTSEDTCIEPGSNSVCSDRGSCVCDEEDRAEIVSKRCECRQGDNYKGRYCHRCETCLVGGSECKDNGLKSCIECLDKEKALEEEKSIVNVVGESALEKSNPITSRMPSACTLLCTESHTEKNVRFKLSVVNLKTFPADKDDESVQCHHQTPDGCKVHFRYFYEMENEDSKNMTLRVEVLPKIATECPTKPYWIIGAVMGSILLIGILTLLIWKVVTHILDAREYTRFEQERAGSKWGQAQNPLYDNPTSTFTNPAYKG